MELYIVVSILGRGLNGFITEKTVLLEGSRGGPASSREEGVQILISIEPHITYDFPGVLTPYPPL